MVKLSAPIYEKWCKIKAEIKAKKDDQVAEALIKAWEAKLRTEERDKEFEEKVKKEEINGKGISSDVNDEIIPMDDIKR